ncbi:MAG: antibiotic biosynthesis monooxygenase family protein [Chitinophagaceae bacterium]
MTRIVKMSFHPHTIDSFLQLFEERKSIIRNFPGCTHLALLKDINDPLQYFTYSIWENEEALNNYRQSDFFVETWGTTKKLFAGKPEAWSVEEI